MTNKVKIMLLMAALGLGVAAVFNAAHAVSGGRWLVSVPATALAALVAYRMYWRTIVRMTNDRHVVPTEHGPDGRLTAIEVFWRPG